MSLTPLLGGRRLCNYAARESWVSWSWDGSWDTGVTAGALGQGGRDTPVLNPSPSRQWEQTRETVRFT